MVNVRVFPLPDKVTPLAVTELSSYPFDGDAVTVTTSPYFASDLTVTVPWPVFDTLMRKSSALADAFTATSVKGMTNVNVVPLTLVTSTLGDTATFTLP